MLETINNIIGPVVKMQLPDGRSLDLEDGPLRTLTLQLMEMAGASPLMLTKMQEPGSSRPTSKVVHAAYDQLNIVPLLR